MQFISAAPYTKCQTKIKKQPGFRVLRLGISTDHCPNHEVETYHLTFRSPQLRGLTTRPIYWLKLSFSWGRSRYIRSMPLQWRHCEYDSVSNHRRLGCLLNRLFRRRLKITSKFCVTVRESTGERWIPLQRASKAGNVSISWRHLVGPHCDEPILLITYEPW